MKYIPNINKAFRKQKKIRIQKRKEKQIGKRNYKKSQHNDDSFKQITSSCNNINYKHYHQSKKKHNNKYQNNKYNKSQDSVNLNTTHEVNTYTNDNEKLHHEINAFVSSILPKQNELLKRKSTIELLTNIIHSRFPKWTVKLFGSYIQGTQTYQSDLDFVIIKDINDIISDADQLELIYALLKNNKFGFNMRYIRARVPIIKAICKSTGISVDISVNKENGFQAAEIIQNQLKAEPGLRQIIIFLKHLLKREGLNDASVGGMSSFVLFSLIFFFYQHIKKKEQNDIVSIESRSISSEHLDTDDEDQDKSKNDKTKENGKDKDKIPAQRYNLNLGKFLLGFLKFYAFKFDDENCGISLINGGEIFYKYEHTHIIEHGSLCIENFQNSMMDIGRSCYHYDMIKEFFQRTLTKLQNAKHNKQKTYLNSIHLTPF